MNLLDVGVLTDNKVIFRVSVSAAKTVELFIGDELTTKLTHFFHKLKFIDVSTVMINFLWLSVIDFFVLHPNPIFFIIMSFFMAKKEKKRHFFWLKNIKLIL